MIYFAAVIWLLGTFGGLRAVVVFLACIHGETARIAAALEAIDNRQRQRQSQNVVPLAPRPPRRSA